MKDNYNVLYRYHDFYSEDLLECKPFLFLYPILKTTKCGVWISIYPNKKFVNLNAKKQWACETIEKARESYLARKKRHIEHLENQLKTVRANFLNACSGDWDDYNLDEGNVRIHY